MSIEVYRTQCIKLKTIVSELNVSFTFCVAKNADIQYPVAKPQRTFPNKELIIYVYKRAIVVY